MALIHQADIRPTKSQLIAEWAPTQPWFVGDADAAVETVATYRFDDPEGEVGIETLLVRFGDGPVLQIPLTYRGAPLEGSAAWLITTMEHSVLGERWVYDATGDPVYIAAVASAAFTGGHEAEMLYEVDGELLRRAPTAEVVGSGRDGAAVLPPPLVDVSTRHEQGRTLIDAGELRLAVERVLDAATQDARDLAAAAAVAARAARAPGSPARQVTLSGIWAGLAAPRILVTAGISAPERRGSAQ